MKTLNRIRTQTGLSQRQLAAFIGKEHTQLHRFESGERTPPADAMQKITLLLQAANQQEESAEPAPLNEAQKKEWQEQAFGCRVQAKKLGRMLQRMEKKALQCRTLLQVLNVLEKRGGLITRQRRWIAEQRYQATGSFITCNDAEQTRLRIRIQLLEMEAELYDAASAQK
jgi:transcriptional regulator with XRE-family HTH domain